jgi:hypothetical protein
VLDSVLDGVEIGVLDGVPVVVLEAGVLEDADGLETLNALTPLGLETG